MKVHVPSLESFLDAISRKLLRADTTMSFVTRNCESDSYSLRVGYGFKIDTIDLEANSAEIIVQRIRKGMTDSPLYQDLTSELRKTIEDQATKIQQLTTKIEELTPFENYYNIQMRINHGETK